MNDSFSQLAKRIRQDKINKKEIKKIKREIIDDRVLKIIKNDMALRIQKCVRGYLYRKKYYSFLEQINTETIIDYLYDKKIKRIQTDYKNIIAHHISNYIINIREEKEKFSGLIFWRKKYQRKNEENQLNLFNKGLYDFFNEECLLCEKEVIQGTQIPFANENGLEWEIV